VDPLISWLPKISKNGKVVHLEAHDYLKNRKVKKWVPIRPIDY